MTSIEVRVSFFTAVAGVEAIAQSGGSAFIGGPSDNSRGVGDVSDISFGIKADGGGSIVGGINGRESIVNGSGGIATSISVSEAEVIGGAFSEA